MFKDWLKSLERNLPKAIYAGVKIGAGTDAGYPPLIFNNVIDELESLVNLGLSPLKALQSATTVAGEVTDTLRKILVDITSETAKKSRGLK